MATKRPESQFTRPARCIRLGATRIDHEEHVGPWHSGRVALAFRKSLLTQSEWSLFEGDDRAALQAVGAMAALSDEAVQPDSANP